MLARCCGGYGLFGVLAAGSADADHIHVGMGQQVGLTEAGDAKPVTDLGEAVLAVMTHRHQPGSQLGVGGNGLAVVVGDHPRAENSKANLLVRCGRHRAPVKWMLCPAPAIVGRSPSPGRMPGHGSDSALHPGQ